ncbi:hypothetical protein D9M68_464000 [compost metagenome]
MARIVILDTSFLLELFNVPGDSTPERHDSARELFQQAIIEGYDVYCPLSVLYELANHIVDIKNSAKRREIAELFQDTVLSAWEERTPFSIIPSECVSGEYHDLSALPQLCHEYRENISQGLGLTDCTIIDVARKIKENYHSRLRKWPAHIWTLQQALKAMEPDAFDHDIY